MASSVLLDPIKFFPPEINTGFFSYFDIKNLLIATLVSKQWREFLNNAEFIWKNQCLQMEKKSVTSWKEHAITLHKHSHLINPQRVKKRVISQVDEFTPINSVREALHQTYTLIHKANIVCIEENKFRAFINDGNPTNFKIWDLDTEKLICEMTCVNESFCALDYPFLATSIGNSTIRLRDLSSSTNDPLKSFEISPARIYDSEVIIENMTLVCCDKTSLQIIRNFQSPTASIFTLKDLKEKFSDDEDDVDDTYEKISSPTILENRLIYGIDTGIIRVRDLNSDQFTILKNLKPLDTLNESERLKLCDESCRKPWKILQPYIRPINSIVANGNLIISSTTSHIRIWDYSANILLKVISINDCYLKALEGHILVGSTRKFTKIWNIFTRECLLESKNKSTTSSFNFYKSKLLELNRPLHGGYKLNVLDFNPST